MHDKEKVTMAKPNDFLRQPVRIRKETVNFKEAELPGCDGLYATVLDDCFTKSECEELVAMAEAQTNGVWEEALVNVGTGKQRMIKEVRDCGRIIWDDADIVARIWDRVKDQVLPDIEYLRNVPLITGNGPTKRKETWRASRLNERMRFLKYGKGQYFNEHMDGCYATPSGEEISFYTLHLYLNDSTDNKIGGGATRFHSMNMAKHFDVEPKTGRVLIFQHKGLLHSGSDVRSGIKLTLRTDIMFKKVAE